MRYPWYKRLFHRLEWGLLRALLVLLRCIGLRRSSWLTGKLGRLIGPRVRSKSNIARDNLRLAFPDWTEARIEETIAGMWENLGRYLGEFPHIAPMSAEEFFLIADVQGVEHMKAAATAGKGSLFFSAHMANWELAAKSSWAYGLLASVIYRPLNNPWVDRTTNEHRNHYQLRGLPKNMQGGRELIKTLREGKPVAILIDQKMSNGIPVPFFGQDAMTSPAVAELAIRYGYPILPVRVERLDNDVRFRITFHPPVEWTPTGDTAADTVTIMRQLHAILEGWIRERPEQWFWVHKRWG